MTLLWGTVAEEFDFEGSWRDVCIPDVELRDWENAFNALRASPFKISFLGGATQDLLTNSLDTLFPPDSPGVVQIDLGGPVLNCHFFARTEIEFDLDPREFRDQSHLDSLLAFMLLLARACGKPALLTPENLHEAAIISVPPDGPPIYFPIMRDLAPRSRPPSDS